MEQSATLHETKIVHSSMNAAFNALYPYEIKGLGTDVDITIVNRWNIQIGNYEIYLKRDTIFDKWRVYFGFMYKTDTARTMVISSENYKYAIHIIDHISKILNGVMCRLSMVDFDTNIEQKISELNRLFNVREKSKPSDAFGYKLQLHKNDYVLSRSGQGAMEGLSGIDYNGISIVHSSWFFSNMAADILPIKVAYTNKDISNDMLDEHITRIVLSI